jgi:hypothetical protein
MFMSVKASRVLSRLLIAWCLSVAAVGCTEKRRIVDAETDGGVAGSAPTASMRAGSGGSESAAAVAGKGGSLATVSADAAGSDEEAQADEDEAPVPSPEENYGWVKFEHTPFGEGKTPNTQLRHSLKVTIVGDESTMTGKGYVMRSSPTTSYVDVAIAITNRNPELRCFVRSESVVWKNADGSEIAGDGHETMTYLSGSVGDSNDSPTTTCLGPGEKGYFLEIQSTQPGMESLFDSLAEVELMLSSSTSSFERPKYRVLPTRWQGSKNQLEVTFKNMGLASAPIERAQGEFILTDADGLPLTWGFLGVETGLTLLAAGSSLVLKSDVYFDGKASNMLVSFGY